MTTTCTDSIALRALDREKWICIFCWCCYYGYETMKVDSSKSWAKKGKYEYRPPTWKGESSVWMALETILGDGWWPVTQRSLVILNKVIVVREAQVEKPFCGIQQTLRWINILLSLSEKVNALKISQSQKSWTIEPIQLYSTGSFISCHSSPSGTYHDWHGSLSSFIKIDSPSQSLWSVRKITAISAFVYLYSNYCTGNRCCTNTQWEAVFLLGTLVRQDSWQERQERPSPSPGRAGTGSATLSEEHVRAEPEGSHVYPNQAQCPHLVLARILSINRKVKHFVWENPLQ